MGKAQKITAVVSVILILALAAVLGIFLWKESRAEQQTGGGSAVEHVRGDDSADGGDSQPSLDDVGGGENDRLAADGTGTGISEEEPETYEEEQDMLDTKKVTEISMVFTGDVLLSDNVRSRYDSGGLGGILSENLQQELALADLAMINEEFPFSDRGTPMEDKQFTFQTDPSYVKVFQEMGIDLVTLANNHALDYGTEALSDTFTTLEEAGISYVGAGEKKERAAQAAYMEFDGRTVGVLAASRVIPVVEWNIENRQPGMLCTYDSAALTSAIRETKKQCDYVVVYVHWGMERAERPEEYQHSLAQAYIDAGADLVVGSHPHVPQGIEYYQGKPIVYSLGNFIFNPRMENTYMLKVVWDTAGESSLSVIPVGAENTFTQELTGQEALELFDYVEGISYGITIDDQGTVHPEGA